MEFPPKMFALSLSIAVLLGFCEAGFPQPSENYNHSIILSDGYYQLYWKVVDDEVTFEIQVKNLGWCGFGISPNGAMAGSDVVIGWVANGMLHFNDRHAVSESMPLIDDQQDWLPLWGIEVDEYTVIKFRRRLRTCDPDDMDINFGTTRLIYSWNHQDPISQTMVSQHDQRGTESVNLLPVPPAIPPPNEKTAVLRFFVNNYPIPSGDTTYYRGYYALPQFPQRHHIVAMDFEVQPENLGMVHHMLIYLCDPDVDPATVVGVGYAEGSDEQKKYLTTEMKCNKMFGGWAIGGQKILYPPDVGFIYGGTSGSRVINMQIHYNNPRMEPGHIDSSGLLFTITSDLRPIEAEMLFVNAPLVIIPPKQADFPLFGVCDVSPYLRQIKTDIETIYLFTTNLHTHLAGRQARLRHFRNGTELPVILDQPHYDSNFQQTTLLPQGPVAVNLKTDTLVMECHYDTRDRNEFTYDNGSTQGEMCMGFAGFYPAIDFLACGSLPIQKNWFQTVGILNYDDNDTITSPKRLAGKPWTVALEEMDWTDPNIYKPFTDFMYNNTEITYCDNIVTMNVTGHITLEPFHIAPWDTVKPVVPCIAKPLEDVDEYPPSASGNCDTDMPDANEAVRSEAPLILAAFTLLLAVYNQ